MTENFTFRSEVLEKYHSDESIYDAFMDSFCAMPLAAKIDDVYLCMHGGISPYLEDIDDINYIDRFIEPPMSGFMCDLLWADPCADRDAKAVGYEKNVERECSVLFGYRPLKSFLKKNKLTSVIRGH